MRNDTRKSLRNERKDVRNEEKRAMPTLPDLRQAGFA
jgi:hypothetical protein